MKGVERDLRDMSISALTKAFEEIRSIECNFAVQPVGSGKSDTYGLDAIPEEAIKMEVENYDHDIVLVTEETGKMYSGELGLEPTQTVLICDPTDRSVKMREFLQKRIEDVPDAGHMSVSDAFDKFRKRWIDEFGNPAISGAAASITAIRDARILFNVMVNYVTGDLFISDSVGTHQRKIGKKHSQEITFSSERRKSSKFMTFLGKKGYTENLQKCNLGLKSQDCIDHWTGGPLRIVDLSSIGNTDVSFIMSNGEKVCEWIGWLSWVKYARDPAQGDERALRAFRLFFESPRTRELVLVAPGPHYSIFSEGDGETRVNLDRMFQLADPSHYRETILITPRKNVAAISRVRSLGKYQVELRL